MGSVTTHKAHNSSVTYLFCKNTLHITYMYILVKFLYLLLVIQLKIFVLLDVLQLPMLLLETLTYFEPKRVSLINYYYYDIFLIIIISLSVVLELFWTLAAFSAS
jgi:hypothetical protein